MLTGEGETLQVGLKTEKEEKDNEEEEEEEKEETT